MADAESKPKYCPRCGGSGKVDRGNGTTKPCDCVAGLIERARRRTIKASRKGENERPLSSFKIL
jgi:hypothetical protein